MDDHELWTKAYGHAVRREFVERLLVAILVLGVCLSGWFVYQSWTTRHMRVFTPVAGLSYAPPQIVDGVIVEDIAGPLTFQKLSPDDAFLFNASVPVSKDPITPSRPFFLPETLGAADAARALDCLTAAVYYEAASESGLGQQAVAQVVLNRLRHPAFPKSVCGVVFSGSTRSTGCQFTFTCDGSLARRPSAAAWERARRVARAALSGHVTAQVGQATHYHTLWVAPYWSPSLVKVANIGAHTFYRWKGATGSPGAFTQAYGGSEPLTPLGGGGEDDAAAAALQVADDAVGVPPLTPVSRPQTTFAGDDRSANLTVRQAPERPAALPETLPPAPPRPSNPTLAAPPETTPPTTEATRPAPTRRRLAVPQ